MHTENIDEAIERYLHERMEKGKETARQRFLARAYMKHGDGLLDYLLKVGGLARCYIRHLRKMEKSFKWPEMAWFAVMAAMGIYAYSLTTTEESQLLGIVLMAGTLVHACSLFYMVTRKMREIGLRIVLYREILQIVEMELNAMI